MARPIMASAIMLSARLRLGRGGAAMVGRCRGGQEPRRQSNPCPRRHGQIGNRNLDQQGQDAQPTNQHTAPSSGTGRTADPGSDMVAWNCPATSHAGEPPVAEGLSHRSRAAPPGQALLLWRDDLPTCFNSPIVIAQGAGQARIGCPARAREIA